MQQALTVDEEGLKLRVKWDGWKEEAFWWVDTPGQHIDRVFAAGDISQMYDFCCTQCRQKILYVLEDLVDGSVSAPPVPPSLNHTFVVALQPVVIRVANVGDNCVSEQLESNSFSPTNVMGAVDGGPSWNKLPCPPVIANGNGDANS